MAEKSRRFDKDYLMKEGNIMKRNAIRIVCNPYAKGISYYFKNEQGEWDVISENSPLSRQFYTKLPVGMSMQEFVEKRIEQILEVIDNIYNRKAKGIDILFEGTTECFEILSSAAKSYSVNRNVKCKLGTTKVAVLGKKSVGKTNLIEGLEDIIGYKYSRKNGEGYTMYSDECNRAQWYEVDGIDLGIDNVDRAFKTVEKLSTEGLSAVIYCISGSSGRIEDTEKNIIKKIEDFASIKTMIALTMCYKDDNQTVYDEIEKVTDQMKIVSTLAKPYKTAGKDKEGKSLVVEAFGVEEVSRFVFEGR